MRCWPASGNTRLSLVKTLNTVFLLVSEEQRQKFGLMSAEKYFYLNQGGSCIIDGKSDKDDYTNLLSAMQVCDHSLLV